MIERRPGRWPASPAGCGEIRNTASRATPKLATSSQYTKRTPAPASSKPASAGPATRPSWNRAWNMAFAVDTSDRRTMFGTMALRPALSSPLNPAARAGSTNNGHSEVSQVGVDRQPGAAAGHQHLRHHQQPAPVHRVYHRSGQQRPGDQREQLGDRHQPDVQRGAGQLVHLVGHRHRGQLGAEHGHELAGDQAAEIAGPPQRRQVDEQAPRGPGRPLGGLAHPGVLPKMTDGHSVR